MDELLTQLWITERKTQDSPLSNYIFHNSVVFLETSNTWSMETQTELAIYLNSSLFKKKKSCLKKENFLVRCTLFFSVNSKRIFLFALYSHTLIGLWIPQVARSVLCQNVISHWQFVLASSVHYLHTHLFALCFVKIR